MNAEDLKELKEVLFYRGFGEKFNAQLEEQIKSGKQEFMLEDIVDINGDEVGYRLHFRRDSNPEKDKVYFNSFDVGLFAIGGIRGDVREHNFSVNHQITAMEAYRMLKHGLLVAVNKNLYNKEGQQYNTWLTIDINGEKDEYGNYPVHSYHENYYKKRPFDVGKSLTQLPVPVKELESAERFEGIVKGLKKANLYAVTILHNGKETPGTLAVNPQVGRTDVYDKEMNLIEYPAQQQRNQKQQRPNDSDGASAQEIKKKTQPNQKTGWTPKPQQRRGQSF